MIGLAPGLRLSVRRLTQRLLAVLVLCFVLCFTLAGVLKAQSTASGSLPPGAKLYIAPMEWQLDRFVAAEIGRRGLPVQVVASPREADFVMTSLFQDLGSHMFSPGHDIQVMIVAVDGGKQVWSSEVNDYAVFFPRLRPHGPGRAAEAIVKELRNKLTRTGP